MKYILKVCIILIFFFFATRVSAQDVGWVINTFESYIKILKNGEIQITENIEADFKNLKKHGIFRDIPYVYNLELGNYYTDLEVKEILRDGKKEKYTTFKNGNNIQLKIGDINKTISGKHDYIITYVVRGVLLPYDSYDELYWDVTGVWPVSIKNASAIVTLPFDGILQFSCYKGYEGYRDECSTLVSSRSALFSTSNLQPYEQMTIAVGFEKGTIQLITVPRPKTFFEQILEPANIVLFLLPIISGFIFILHHWYRNGRDVWSRGKHLFDPHAIEEIKPIGSHDQIVVEYTPPGNLRPAELGVLMDERADTLDVTATIIDLAARGYFTITEIPKKGIFGKVDYQLDRSDKDIHKLLTFEKLLVEKLFENKKTIKVSQLKNKFYSDLSNIKKELYVQVVKDNLFPTDPEKVREKYFLIGITLFIGSVFGVIFLSPITVKIFLAGIMIFSIFFIIFSRFMPRRTVHGREIYRRSKGYYEFISHVEKYRQRFFERKNMLNEILPYAIVFGITKEFAKALKDIGVEPKQQGWYVGVGAFDVKSFEKNVQAFSNSLSTAISSAPRSSGSSSGGSSGGGFGGGGGGSW